MGLHLIIDGYNLIRGSAGLSAREAESLEAGRAALLARLTAYKRLKAWPVTVVFDAAGGPHLADRQERVGGVVVVYSGAGRSADEVIIGLARRQGRRAVVVTSDRSLAASVESAGAVCLDSTEFENRLDLAFYLDHKGLGEPEEDQAPTLSTRKKGPGRRRPRSVRKKAARLVKI
ncbi:MAG: NYN domain-containing protein [Thermodesulfobacteriota bacterium]